MPDSENKTHASQTDTPSSAKPQPGVADDVLRDESTLYGDEADIPARQSKKPSQKKKNGKRRPSSKKPSADELSFPKVAPKYKKSKRKKRPVYRSIFEWMSAGSSFFKPIRVFGRDIRFWPLIVLAAIFLLASGVMLNNSNLNVVEQKVTIVGLPEELEGYRIVVLSDMNARRFGDAQSLLLRTLNGIRYDAVFCLGDMVGADGNARPFWEFLEGLRNPEKVYFICGDSDPGPYVQSVRNVEGPLSQFVLEDWILGAVERGANYVDAPTLIQVRNANLWISPATMLNLEATSTLEVWADQTAQEESGVQTGIAADYASLPITSYRYQIAQRLYEAQRAMVQTDVHISLAHERPSEDFIYTAETHDLNAERFLTAPELILAGHYCGGVWRVPLLGAFYVPDKTLPRGGWFPDQSIVAGLSSVDETQIYVTKGLSTNGAVNLLPFRLFNGPEVSVLTLTSTLPENMLEAG